MRSNHRSAALAAALLFSLSSATGYAQKPAATPEVAAAEAHFFAGQKAYADKHFEEALVELRASYAAAPSPNSHLYIARCLRQLNRLGAAYEEYAQVIVESADRIGSERKYESTQKAAAEERAALKDRIAILAVTMPVDAPGARLYVGDDEIPAARWIADLTVTAGALKVRAEAPGRAVFETSITLAAGAKERITILLPATGALSALSAQEAPPTRTSPGRLLRPAAYTAAGVGVVGLVLWAALGTTAASRYDALQQVCGGRCDASHQGEIDAGRSETAGSRAGLAIGILGVAAGATIWTVDYLGRRGKPVVGSVTLRIAPSPLAPGAVVGGSF
jgi:hypothetical protein